MPRHPRFFPALLFVISALGCAHGAAAPKAKKEAADTEGGHLTPAQIAERATPSVVLIKTPTGLGSGFIVWQDGRIATNLHVIAGATKATVILADGRQFSDVEVLKADPERDLAVLRIPARNLHPLQLGDDIHVKPGERVVAIGHPLGLGNTVSDGLVSGIRKLSESLTVLQISAPISPGSSGGPLFNDRGQVIGIATAFLAEGQNLNLAMPIRYLRPLLLVDRGQPIAEFGNAYQLAQLEGCKATQLKTAAESIMKAIDKGAPTYNKGDHKGCFEIYQTTALALVPKLEGCKALKDMLLDGLGQANHASDFSKKAWAMRHAFDDILDLVKRYVESQDAGAPKTP